MRIIRDLIKKHWLLLLLLLCANVWKVILYRLQAFPFNADEAVVGLMAQHILKGERPLFFYGQAYMGSLDAWFVAGGFYLFGQSIWVIRAIQTLLYSATILLWYLFLYRATQSIPRAALTALLLAFPPVFMTLYTTVSLGGYGEALCIGSVCLVLTTAPDGRIPWRISLLAIFAGFGVWVFPLSLVYSLPALIICACTVMRQTMSAPKRWMILSIFIIGLAIGAAPLLLGWAQYGAALIQEMSGSAIAGTLQGGILEILWLRILGLFLFGSTVTAGLRPPWEFRWLALPLLPLVLALWFGAIAYSLRAIRVWDGLQRYRLMLFASLGLFAVVFVATPFGNDPSGRYFLPLYPIGSAALSGLLYLLWRRIRWLGGFCTGIVILYFSIGTLKCALQMPPGLTAV
jgi:4-amino-4-deoxy-L-arabinose transferase-like glycosyltransferase